MNGCFVATITNLFQNLNARLVFEQHKCASQDSAHFWLICKSLQELTLFLDVGDAWAIQATDLWISLGALKKLTDLFIHIRSKPDIDFYEHLSLLENLRYNHTMVHSRYTRLT